MNTNITFFFGLKKGYLFKKLEQISCQIDCIQLSFFSLGNYEWVDFQIENKIAMYKKYESPNFKFWLLTILCNYTLTYNYKGKKKKINKFKWGVESQSLKQ